MIHAKVLVVDHEQGTYDVLKPGLAKRGYEMHTTTTMTKALALAGAHVYQAAFVSLALAPDRTVLDGLHAEIPDLPVISSIPQNTPTISHNKCLRWLPVPWGSLCLWDRCA
jgi:Response regulator containing CheY-like receiver, AAA-type ATPase, and DNA-binding domains